MRNEQVDVFERQTVVLQQFGADGGKAAHSLLEDFTPLHLEVKIVLNRIAGLVVAVRPAADGKQGILPPVRTAPDIPEAGGRGQAPLGRPGVAVRQHGGRGAVAEQDAGRAVFPVQAAGKGFRAHEQDFGPGLSGKDAVRHVQAVNEAGAGRVEVERHRPVRADFAADDAGRARAQVVGRTRRRQNMRDVFSRDAGIFKSFKRRFRARVGAVFVVRQHVPGLDPGPADDPFVVGVHQRHQVDVRDPLGRNIRPQALNMDCCHAVSVRL